MASILNVDKIRATGSTTDALSIDSSGRVAQPALPYAMVNIASDTTVTPDVKVPYDTVLNSSGISWNTTDSTFTVPVTGVYHFSGAVRVNAERTYAYWYVADSAENILQSGKLVLAHGHDSLTSFTTATGSCLLRLTVSTDYHIRFSDSTNGSVGMSGSQTWMDIHLVG